MPKAFIEFKRGYVGVEFLDASLRCYLSYTFQEVKPNRLFLTRATHREFDGASDRVKSGTTLYFKQDGGVTIITEDCDSQTHTREETRSDVSGNWEPYPEFGNYDSIVRVER